MVVDLHQFQCFHLGGSVSGIVNRKKRNCKERRYLECLYHTISFFIEPHHWGEGDIFHWLCYGGYFHLVFVDFAGRLSSAQAEKVGSCRCVSPSGDTVCPDR